MPETLDPILPSEVQDLATRTLQRACDAELKLATAESCTGGILAALLSDVEGCGHALNRGYVTYDPEAKIEMLGLDRAIVEQNKAVNKEVAVAMAEAALERSDTDIAIAITGFAGPGKEEDGDEEGLVHFGCALRGEATRHREEHYGPQGRDGVRRAALATALEMLEEAVNTLAERKKA